uniref:Cytochrome c oxidase assembly factor 1 homolog n=1 Tax=Sus scrofa TaxID=9823 RepID=A0A8D1I3Q4_PIG
MSVPLGKLVFFSSVATSGTCTLLYFLIQKMFSRASYYQLALEHLHSHAEALEALGTPLSVHYLQLTDKYNFEDIADAQLRIPVSGPKSEGHLYVSSSREGPFRRWNLQEVFLELRDGHRIPVFKPSGEGPARSRKPKVSSGLMSTFSRPPGPGALRAPEQTVPTQNDATDTHSGSLTKSALMKSTADLDTTSNSSSE